MFNSYSSSETNVNNSFKVNAVTGNILKNYQKSFFKRFKLDSPLAKWLFNEDNPHIKNENYPYNERPVVIIQMMMCGESSVLAELMWKEDFDEMFICGMD